jgi:hypothetical protein
MLLLAAFAPASTVRAAMSCELFAGGRFVPSICDEMLVSQGDGLHYHARVRRRGTDMRGLMALMALGFAAPVMAQGKRSARPELARAADELQPGQWVWASSIAPSGPILIYVDLSRQRATVYRNGVRIGVSTISSGKEGMRHPRVSSPSCKRMPPTAPASTTMPPCPISSG